LSPFDPLAFLTAGAAAAAHLAARRFDEAIEWADRALQDQPRQVPNIRIKLVACAHPGRLDEARSVLAHLLSSFPEMTVSRWCATIPATSFGPEYVELNVAGLRLASLPEG
jgi:hypothetical protein